MPARNKWQPKQLKVNKTKVVDERFEQLLAEVGEVLYKRLCQQVVVPKNKDLISSTEPSLDSGLDKDKNFNQLLKKGS